MNLGIVGNAQDKFTAATEAAARAAIKRWIEFLKPQAIVSGRCPLGGVDIYAEEIAKELSIPTIIHEPKVHAWGAPDGYKARNLLIAKDSDKVLVIVVADYPPDYVGMQFAVCYHCGQRRPRHVKSGGCWTALQAKEAIWEIIP